MKLIANLLLALFLLPNAVFAQKPPPKFKDYPSTEIYRGKRAKIKLTKADMAFRTRLRYAAQHGRIDFAGHYILTWWGCGAECRMGAAIDARTGKVYWFDFTICCWRHYGEENFEPIDYRLNSKLIIFHGLRNEKENDRGSRAHYYKFENGRFIHLRTVLEKTD